MKLLPIDDGIVDDVDDPARNEKFSKAMPLINQGITKLLKLIPSKHSDGPRAEGDLLPVDLVIVGTFLGIDATRTIIERQIPYILFVAGGLNMVTTALSNKDGEPLDSNDGQMLFMSPTPDNVPPDRVVKTMFLPLKESVPYAAALVVNSLQEFEQPTISRLGVLLDKTKPVFCIGPLLPESKVVVNDLLTVKFREWLDRQKPLSVIYVSFGTVMAPKPDQLKEISQALVQLNQPVIWSLKIPHHKHLSDDFQSVAQFGIDEDATNDNQVLVVQCIWVPQKMILTHNSVGLFVSHSGWNSTIEALSGGKPMVCWPQFGDQLINAELVDRNRAGVVVRDAHMTSDRVVPVDPHWKAQTENFHITIT